MFEFIKKLFKKEKEVKAAGVDNKTEVIPELKESSERLKNTIEAFREESTIRAIRKAELQNELDRIYTDLNLSYKFRDTTTGEVHVVPYSDHETFDKMMNDKNMQMIFG